MDLIKNKNLFFLEDIGQKMKRPFIDWEKIFTTKCMIKDLYPEYIKNSQNAIISKQSGQMIWTDTSTKRDTKGKQAQEKMFNIVSH